MTDNHKKILEEFNKLIYSYNQGKLHNDLYDMNRSRDIPLFAITKSMQEELGNFLIQKLQEQSKEYEEELVRLRTYWKKKLQEERESVYEEIRKIIRNNSAIIAHHNLIVYLNKIMSQEEHET